MNNFYRVGSILHLPPVELDLEQLESPTGEAEAGACSDAELYRILVAAAICTGLVTSKAHFDRSVRKMGTLAAAEERLALSKKRYGCRAYRHGRSFVCDCGASWPVDADDPPACRGADLSPPSRER